MSNPTHNPMYNELLKKPLWQMTGEEFLVLMSVTNKERPQTITQQKENVVELKDDKYVFGLKGICELLGVCERTALRYKNTFLQPAIKQHGRKIVVDKEKALQLFSEIQ